MNRPDLVKPRKRASALVMNALAVITVIVLVYIVINTDFGLILAQIRSVSPLLFAALLGLQLCTQLALNYQWFRLCKVLKLPASFGRLLVVSSYGTLMDATTPGEKVGGELARVVQLNRVLGFSVNQSTSLVTIQKSLSLASLLVLNIAAMIILTNRVSFLSPPYLRFLLYAVLFSLAALLLYALLLTPRLNKRVQRIKSGGRLAARLKSWVEEFSQNTGAISGRPGEWVFQFALSLVIWALFPLKLYIIVSLYTSINPFVLFAITFISYFAAMIPLLPGGLGTFEAAMSAMLMAYSLSAEGAMAISLIFRFITFWFVALFSLLVVLSWKSLKLLKRRQQ